MDNWEREPKLRNLQVFGEARRTATSYVFREITHGALIGKFWVCAVMMWVAKPQVVEDRSKFAEMKCSLLTI